MTGIFLDYQSTTPTDPRVVTRMLPYFTEHFGNPHSAEHDFGLTAQHAIDAAMLQVAQVVGADREHFVVTSGATEANNLALRGTVTPRKKAHLISVVTEHQSVLSTLASLEADGHSVTLLRVDRDGLVDPEEIAAAIQPNTRVVSVMAVNSEIGVIQPYAEIGHLCRSRDILMHVDAAQGFGRLSIDVRRDAIDLMSISAHKIYGPKGIGALYVGPRARPLMKALITGGGQQGGLRSGTVPTPLVVGMGEAARLMKEEGAEESVRLGTLRARLWDQLCARIDGVTLNGSLDHRWVGNLNIRFDDVDADSLLLMLPGLAMSTGSACSSGTPEPSKVLRALGLSVEHASQSLRLGLGRMTTQAEVDSAVVQIAEAVARYRA